MLNAQCSTFSPLQSLMKKNKSFKIFDYDHWKGKVKKVQEWFNILINRNANFPWYSPRAYLSKSNTKLKPKEKNSNILHLTNVIRLKLNTNDEKQMWTVNRLWLMLHFCWFVQRASRTNTNANFQQVFLHAVHVYLYGLGTGFIFFRSLWIILIY